VASPLSTVPGAAFGFQTVHGHCAAALVVRRVVIIVKAAM
jgi:hypothetical protein